MKLDSLTVTVTLTEEERHHALALARGAITGCGAKNALVPCPRCAALAEKFARVAVDTTEEGDQ